MPWKILGFVSPKINTLLLSTESGLALSVLAVLYLQTSLLSPWRTIIPTPPSIILEEDCLREHAKSEHDALAAFLRDLLHHFDIFLQHAVLTGIDLVTIIMPVLRLRLALPPSVLIERHCTKDSNAIETSVLELVLAEVLQRREIGSIDRLKRTVAFLEGLLRERDSRVAVMEVEKDQIISFIKAVKSSHNEDVDILFLCNEILGHSD